MTDPAHGEFLTKPSRDIFPVGMATPHAAPEGFKGTDRFERERDSPGDDCVINTGSLPLHIAINCRPQASPHNIFALYAALV